jgi:hypothetical protein
MRNRLSALFRTAFALFLVVGSPIRVTADDVKSEWIEGKVTSIRDKTLVMTSADGVEKRFTVVADAKNITIDGKNVALESFKPGMRIRVTPDRGDRGKVTRIEGLRFNKDFDRR